MTGHDESMQQDLLRQAQMPQDLRRGRLALISIVQQMEDGTLVELHAALQAHYSVVVDELMRRAMETYGG
jgi:hypothetical protein